MASPVSPSPHHRKHYYEPSPRFNHYATTVGGKLYTWGGRTQDFSDIGKVLLRSAIEIFDPYLEVWDQQATSGDPPPGLYGGACAAFPESMYVCFGNDGKSLHSTIHHFDTAKLEWKQVQVQNPSEGPRAKSGFGMVAYQGDKLVLFAGHGISSDSIQNGASFVKSGNTTGWSNELHLLKLRQGIWTSPPTTGEKPPPCSAFSFTAIDDHRVVFFGGFQASRRKANDAYILDLQTMHWRKLSNTGREMPDPRSAHSACCINFGEDHPQLLVTGGRNSDDNTLKDAWLLDIDSESWKELVLPDDLPARWGHTTTAFSLCPGLAEVAMFGGSPKFIPGARSDDQFPQVAETIVLQLESVEVPSSHVTPSSREWVLVGVADNRQLGTPERVQEKMDKVQQRVISAEEKDITPEERATRAAREEIEEANRRAQDARREVESLQKALEESQARLRQLGEEKERAAQEAAEQIEVAEHRTRELERQLQTKEDEARMQQQQVDTFQRQLESKEDQIKREKQQAAKVPSLERLLHSREGVIKEMQEQVSTLKQQLESKELEVIFLQHNLKEREDEVKQKEDEVKRKEEEMREQHDQLTTQLQSLEHQMSEYEKQYKKEMRELLMDVQAGITLMHQLEERLETKQMSPFTEGSHSPTIQYPTTVQIREAEVQEKVSGPTELVETAAADFRHESSREGTADATEQGAELIQLRPETTTNQQQEIIREQKEHIEQQQEHMGEVWKQVDQLQDILTIREAELHHLKNQVEMETRREPTSSSPLAHLCGTDIVAQITFILTQEAQNLQFRGYGFKLHVPQGSLPSGISETTLNVRVSLSGQFQMPPDCELLSAIYWVYSPHEFKKPLTVEIQHSAVLSSDEQCEQLTFVSTNCTQEELPYVFRLRDGGVFSHHSSYGSLSLPHFSGHGVAKRKASRRSRRSKPYAATSVQATRDQPKRLTSRETTDSELSKLSTQSVSTAMGLENGKHDEELYDAYCGQVYTKKEEKYYRVCFVITKNLDAHRTVVEEFYSTKSHFREDIHMSLGFDGEIIQLSIPKSGEILESGWKIWPRIDPIIRKRNVDHFSGSWMIPNCELLLRWTHKGTPDVCLEHEVNLSGAKNCSFFTLFIPDAGNIPTELPSTQVAVLEETKTLGIEDLADITSYLHPVGRTAVFNLGLILGLDYNRLSSLRESSSQFLNEMLAGWLQKVDQVQKAGVPTWRRLVEALRDPRVGHNGIVSTIEKAYKPTTMN